MNTTPDTITIEGQTYTKQTGPSKQEKEAAKALSTKVISRNIKVSLILSFVLGSVGTIFMETGFIGIFLIGFIVFVPSIIVAIATGILSVHKQVAKETLDAITPVHRSSFTNHVPPSPRFYKTAFRDCAVNMHHRN